MNAIFQSEDLMDAVDAGVQSFDSIRDAQVTEAGLRAQLDAQKPMPCLGCKRPDELDLVYKYPKWVAPVVVAGLATVAGFVVYKIVRKRSK